MTETIHVYDTWVKGKKGLLPHPAGLARVIHDGSS